jgi:hypothetical protein
MITYTSQISTTSQLTNQVAGDVGLSVGQSIGIVLGIAVFIVSVGFAWRKLKKYAVGKGF